MNNARWLSRLIDMRPPGSTSTTIDRILYDIAYYRRNGTLLWGASGCEQLDPSLDSHHTCKVIGSNRELMEAVRACCACELARQRYSTWLAANPAGPPRAKRRSILYPGSGKRMKMSEARHRSRRIMQEMKNDPEVAAGLSDYYS